MPRPVLFLTLLHLLGWMPSASAQDIALERRETRWRITAEELGLDGEEDLALVGIHFDALAPVERLPELYAGLGGYLAGGGERGGFHVGGLTVGWLRDLGFDFWFDAGLFAGGGGGGGAGFGESSGLMLRPHVGIERALDSFSLRFELARIEFPDGDIEDTHLALGVSLPSEVLVARERELGALLPEGALIERDLRAGPRVAYLELDDGARRDSGGRLVAPVQLLGFGLDYFLTPTIFLPAEVYGATGGDVDGFSMALAGLGFALPLGSRTTLEAKGQIGAGGGGDVDTGGGFGWSASVGLHARVFRGLGLDVRAGRLAFPDGSFEADMVTAGLTTTTKNLELDLRYPRRRLTSEGLDSDRARLSRTRVQVLHKSYAFPGDVRRVGGGDHDSSAQLVGFGIEQPLTRSFGFQGRAFGAYDGELGGYAEGWLGLRYELRPPRTTGHVFSIVGSGGAGGGGGADVGSGLLWSYSGGYRYEFGETLSFVLEAGRVEADEGSFEAQSFVFGLAWDLQRAYGR